MEIASLRQTGVTWLSHMVSPWCFSPKHMKRLFCMCLSAVVCLLVCMWCVDTFIVRTPLTFYGKQRKPWTQTNDAQVKCDADANRRQAGVRFMSRSAIPCKTTQLLVINGTWQGCLSPKRRAVSCPRLRLLLAPKKLPLTGLVSFPGSGNTWTRHLIQQLTGLQTGAVYHDLQLRKRGFLGEGMQWNVVVVKTHLTAVVNTKVVDFDRQILLLRNPFDAVVAEYKRHSLSAGHVNHVNISIDDNWLNYVDSRVREWSYFVRVAVSFPGPQIILLYEDLQSCLGRELMRLALFLAAPPTLTRFSPGCAVTHSRGYNYRNQTKVPLVQLYPPTQAQNMNDMLATLAEDMAGSFPVLSRRLLDYRLRLDD